MSDRAMNRARVKKENQLMPKMHPLAVTLSLIAVVWAAAGQVPALASSHREAPILTEDPAADNTDVYAFRSPDDPNTVTIIANYIPLEEPGGGPNFHRFDDNVRYSMFIDNDGDAVAEIEFGFFFTTTIRDPSTFRYNTGPVTSLDDPDLNVVQRSDVLRVDEGVPAIIGLGVPVVPNNVGPQSTPAASYEAMVQDAITGLTGGGSVFLGPRDDPFYVDLGSVFDLLGVRRFPGNMGGGRDGLSGMNVHSIALKLPIGNVTRDGSVPTDPNDPAAVIGVWAGAFREERRTLMPNGQHQTTGVFLPVSRLGMPLVNEVVIPLADKDKFNQSRPEDDSQFLSYILDPEFAQVLAAVHGFSVPPPPREDLNDVFLKGLSQLNRPVNVVPGEMLRLNVAIPPASSPNRLGVLGGDLAGFPNGRRLADDVVDVELRVVAGVLVSGFDVFPNNALGDGVDRNDVEFLDSFPYMATPHEGFEHPHLHD